MQILLYDGYGQPTQWCLKHPGGIIGRDEKSTLMWTINSINVAKKRRIECISRFFRCDVMRTKNF